MAYSRTDSSSEKRACRNEESADAVGVAAWTQAVGDAGAAGFAVDGVVE